MLLDAKEAAIATAADLHFGTSEANDGRSEWSFIPFTVRPAGDAKGLGAFASKAYVQGDLVLAESPLALLVVPDRDRVSRGVATDMIKRMVESLHPWRKAAYFLLSQEEGRFGTKPSAVGVWLSNAYPMGDAGGASNGGGDRQGVFSQICRINHSCQPNVAVCWNARRKRQTVRALQPINIGDELTVSFYGADGLEGMVRAERQQLLHAKMGFDCQCSLCSLQGTAFEQSEARQRRLRAISKLMASEAAAEAESGPPRAKKRRYDRMVVATKEALALMQEERMPDTWLKLYHLRLVSSAADAGDLGAAEGWAAKAAKCTRDTFGADSDEYSAHVQ